MARIWIEAYGCAASFADSEMISGIVLNGGHTLAKSPEDSDLGIVITCSVKDATANRMIHRIKSLRNRPMVVAGCLPKAERGRVEKFAAGASLLGPNSIGKALQVVDSTLMGRREVELKDTDASKTGLPRFRMNDAVGIVEIASGCMSECSFCQTKLAKGNLTSYRVGDIVRQIKEDLDDGCKEIWLTSTDNGCYGFDIGSSLPELVNSAARIPGNFRIRVGMMNPMYMPRIRDGLLESFESEKIYRFLHIPVQSGNDEILRDMRRGHTRETFVDTVSRFRRRFGEFTISTDIIVGFPTETEEAFLDTIDLLKETEPDIINLSRYSARPGTEASEWKQLDASTIKSRSRKITDLVTEISRERNASWRDWEGSVLFDEMTEEGVKGRNYAYKPIFVNEGARVGQSNTVRIIDATPHSLVGEIIA